MIAHTDIYLLQNKIPKKQKMKIKNIENKKEYSKKNEEQKHTLELNMRDCPFL